jgi:hypothetical protein
MAEADTSSEEYQCHYTKSFPSFPLKLKWVVTYQLHFHWGIHRNVVCTSDHYHHSSHKLVIGTQKHWEIEEQCTQKIPLSW